MTLKQNNTTTSWSTVADLRKQIQRLWDRGELLRLSQATVFASNSPDNEAAVVEFPRRLTVKKPTSKQASEQFAQVREWIRSLAQCKFIRIEYRETKHQVLGKNELPNAVWVDSLDDALSFISCSAEAKRFSALCSVIVEHDVRLLEWLYKRPLKALELLAVMEKLMQVHSKMLATPKPGIYLRQLSVPGVDTKFIEQHRDTLAEWLDLTLPESAIDNDYRGIKGFTLRYGFKDKPIRLRMRSLDGRYPFPDFAREPSSANALTEVMAQADVTLDISVLGQLQPTHTRVLITENEINYLALPDMRSTLALFGAGYGWSSMQEIPWLQALEIFYWGDIDTHGFAILDDLRGYLPQVQSLLMDRDTLLAHEALWGQESSPTGRPLARLTDAEQAVYQALVSNRYGDAVRLEQEQLNFAAVAEVLADLDRF